MRLFPFFFSILLFASPIFAQDNVRVEHDLLGSKEIPNDAYYGIQTARALENFQISNVPINTYPEFIKALAMVKLAAARANTEVGKMDKKTLKRIEPACEEVIKGNYHDQFIIDMYQGGAGTSTNMNANEVLANIALELMGKQKGDYETIEPHDHLNMSQSTNDSYPTSIKVATILYHKQLDVALEGLIQAFAKLGKENLEIVKMGRTELQDAVPITVGQEFYGYARALTWERNHLNESIKHMYAINMGGTAIGTGLNAPKGYAESCAKHLAEITGAPIYKAEDLIAATWDLQGFAVYSGALKSLAIKLAKISSDLRLLASGPRTGLYEINLPALQPGSSIMPGKVNPVIPELMSEICFRVIANDLAVTLSAENGDLQLNAFEPLVAIALFESQEIFTSGITTFTDKCVSGITVNTDIQALNIERSIGIVTALNPVLGYDQATALAKEALERKMGILELIREKKILTEEEIQEVLNPETMTGLNKEMYND